MIAITVFVLVIAGVGSVFTAVVKMSRTAFTEAELALNMRQLREKLLFHVAPPHDGYVWSGLLSADAGVENSQKIRAASEGVYAVESSTKSGETVAQSIELVQHSGERYFTNDGDRYDDNFAIRWLTPGGLSLLPGDDDVFALDDGESIATLEDSFQAQKNLYFINLRAKVNGVERGERIVVPIFGKAQVRNTGSVFHD